MDIDLVEALERAWTGGAEHLAAVTPAHLASATPCDGWDVRALLNHTLGESVMFTEVNRDLPASNDHGDLVGDGTGVLGTWEQVAKDNVASWRNGGIEGDRTYFFGTFPAPAALVVNLAEVLVHTWDLATALGRPVVLEPDLVELALGLYAEVPMNELREHGVYAAEVVVPETASATDRLLALLGRQPLASAAVVRGADAEVLAAGPNRLELLVDATDAGGAITAHRVRLAPGAPGAWPHRHVRSNEVFFVLDGRLDVLVGDDVVHAVAGDLVVVPPGTAHAFGATAGHGAEVLVVVTPGIERFEFYREVARIAAGTSTPAALDGTEERYDTHGVASPAWAAARSA